MMEEAQIQDTEPLSVAEPFGGAEEFNPCCECCTCEWTAADGTPREGCPAEVVWDGEYYCLLCYLEAEAEHTGIRRWVEAFWTPAAVPA